jgi:adenine-specific DNA-methyltransferase
VTISTSTDERFDDYTIYEAPFDLVVRPNDAEYFIHIPTTPEKNALETSPVAYCSLTDLKIEVSTGPVVDFRLKEHLRAQPDPETVPLLYPGHFTAAGIEWPQLALKKPNALHLCATTKKWLFPKGFYTVVRRFSSKEEKRRIVANIVQPELSAAEWVGFENHLNVFHRNKQSLPEELAYGLSLFLNSTFVDEYFRRFSGHTQVNATDLRLLKYPDRATLCALGGWAKSCYTLTQSEIDEKIKAVMVAP